MFSPYFPGSRSISRWNYFQELTFSVVGTGRLGVLSKIQRNGEVGRCILENSQLCGMHINVVCTIKLHQTIWIIIIISDFVGIKSLKFKLMFETCKIEESPNCFPAGGRQFDMFELEGGCDEKNKNLCSV